MKRYTIPFAIIICMLMFTPVRADITWTETEFDYILKNKSYFFYLPNQYGKDYNQYIIKSEPDPYSSSAEIILSEYFTNSPPPTPPPGSPVVQMQGEAKGPEGGTDPPDGLIARAYLDTVAADLNDAHGADIDLEAVSRVVRRFEVIQTEQYRVQMDLTGLPEFDVFYENEHYRAYYSVYTEVTLEQVEVVGDGLEVEVIPGFPVELDEIDRTATVVVQLDPYYSEQRGYYRIKTELKLKSRIDNFRLQGFVVGGEVNGTYQVGTLQSPFELQTAFIAGGTGDSDGDGVPDDIDNCPEISNPAQLDDDGDGVGNICDDCPDDPLKDEPGLCGCGTPDTDSDSDGTLDCLDGCPLDPEKIDPGICGCGVPDSDTDSDGDGFVDCIDAFPDDPAEWEDSDQDGIGDNADPDDDNDGMPDDWETLYGLDPLEDEDADEDPDGDGWSNLKEFMKGTDPRDPASYPMMNTAAMLATLFLLLDGEPDDGEIDCGDFMIDGCQLPAPFQLKEVIETEDPDKTYVTFSWSADSGAECIEGYSFAMNTDPNLFNNPTTFITSRALPSYRADFSLSPADTYYWAVASRCNKFTSETGDWSAVKTFVFNP